MVGDAIRCVFDVALSKAKNEGDTRTGYGLVKRGEGQEGGRTGTPGLMVRSALRVVRLN